MLMIIFSFGSKAFILNCLIISGFKLPNDVPPKICGAMCCLNRFVSACLLAIKSLFLSCSLATVFCVSFGCSVSLLFVETMTKRFSTAGVSNDVL